MSNNMHLDDTLVGVAQRAYLERAAAQSCKPRKKEIKGEVYVSREPSRQDKIGNARNVILGLAAFIAVAGTLKYSADFETASQIRKEVVTKEINIDSRGNNYTDFVRDDGFVDAMIDLSDGSLIKLYDETSKEMKAEGNIEEAKIISEVVDEMEEEYIREHGKSR